MKRLIAIVLFLSIITGTASAAVNLSLMSYRQLMDLQIMLTKEIMSRPEWKEVEVPAGQWRVGTDIPAGSYSITPKDKICGVTVWRKMVNDYSDGGLYYSEVITEEQPCGRIILNAGWIVELSKPVIFAPPLSLGF